MRDSMCLHGAYTLKGGACPCLMHMRICAGSRGRLSELTSSVEVVTPLDTDDGYQRSNADICKQYKYT